VRNCGFDVESESRHRTDTFQNAQKKNHFRE
jgi:hypothetical protein